MDVSQCRPRKTAHVNGGQLHNSDGSIVYYETHIFGDSERLRSQLELTSSLNSSVSFIHSDHPGDLRLQSFGRRLSRV